MRIGLDIRPIARGGGIGRATLRMVEQLLLICNERDDLQIVLFTDSKAKHDLLDKNRDSITYARPLAWRVKRVLPFVAEHLLWPLECARFRLDSYVAFAFPLGMGFVFARKLRIGLQVHDLSAYSYPELFTHSSWFSIRVSIPVAMRSADVIFTVSAQVGDELASIFPSQAHKALEVPLAVDQIFAQQVSSTVFENIRKRFGIRGSYLLWCGNSEPYKNLPLLIDAYVRLRADAKFDRQLVLIGITEEELKGSIGYDPPEDIVCTGLLRYEEEPLPALYQNAELFIFPSLHESVGLPLLEAMAAGLPIITSDIPSIRATTQGNAVYIDPQSTVELSDSIISLINDDKTKIKLRDVGRQIVGLHSWNRSANMLLSGLIDSHHMRQ